MLLLGDIAKDLVMHGYTNMSVEYTNSTIENLLIIREFQPEPPYSILKTVFSVCDDKVFVETYLNGNHECTYEMKGAINWFFKGNKFIIADETMERIEDAFVFDTDQERDIIIA